MIKLTVLTLRGTII